MIGEVIWIAAAVITSISVNFGMLSLGRTLTGAAEGAFMSMGPPIVMKIAPKGKTSLYLGVFYASLPLGTALGFIYGQIVA